MRFQRGPGMAYAAVVLIGLLVIIQTLSPDVSSLHRVPRTLSGQAEFTVIPPAPSPGVSGVSKIPSAAPGANAGDDREAAAEPDEQAEKNPEKATPAPPAEQQPDVPSPDQPAEPADPGGDEGETKPPALVPPVGPIPGIMAPLLWPFVAEKDARPVDQAVPMFLQQLLAAEAGVPVEALPMEDPKDARKTDEATGEAKEPASEQDGRESEAERIAEGACEITAAIGEDVEELPGASEAPEPRATPECGEACTEPKTPVGSSPAADPEVTTTDSADPSDAETTEAPDRVEEPKDGSKDEKTCAEKSVQ
ncbi:hypothetical protein [Nocardioides panzhihuensis]|uniref:Uncharacterized protein n=1 Tax=Nocardioides panzhihuensis TaxID=860243 RepID=A0A7Z0IQY6_9ACTN|nr:hypothetical protein [Nocardioides panzhihuensis]NYI76147.1 hypothetical protein [Nocardioides panzhihuensis]